MLGALIFLNILAEWTVAKLHVCKFVLISYEEATTVFAHGDGHIRHHVLEVPFGTARTEVGHVLDEYFLVAHTAHHLVVDHYGTIVIRCCLTIHVLQKSLGEQVIL